MPHDIRITSLRQAYDILGLPAGAVTISEARAAWRDGMAQYHPDKVSHLAKDLRDLAARRALEINLAFQFIENNLRSG
jgi:DnaJ-class molecular chaperone